MWPRSSAGRSFFIARSLIRETEPWVIQALVFLKKWMLKEIHLFLGMTGIFSEPLFFFHLHSSFEWSFSVAAFHYFYRAWNWIFNFAEKEKKWLNYFISFYFICCNLNRFNFFLIGNCLNFNSLKLKDQ
jgi:hypothetical protein